MFSPRIIACLWITGCLTACAIAPGPAMEQTALSSKTIEHAATVAAGLVELEQLGRLSQEELRQQADLRDELWQFERQVIRAAIRLEQQDYWDEAGLVFQQATHAAPKSGILSSAQQQFLVRRTLREEVLRAELAIHQGEQLLQNANAYDSLQRVSPLKFLTWMEQNAYERRRRDTADMLRRYAGHAVEREDYYLARRCLSISYRLNSDETVKQNLMLVEAYIREIRNRIDSPTAAGASNDTFVTAEKADTELLVGRFHYALQKEDYISAKRYMSELQRHYPKHRNLTSMNSKYRLQLNRRVHNAIEQGKELYSEGNVEEALRVWRDVEQLAPDNVELLSSITRAEKVLQNLKALSARQARESS